MHMLLGRCMLVARLKLCMSSQHDVCFWCPGWLLEPGWPLQGSWRGRQQPLIHFLRPWPPSKITADRALACLGTWPLWHSCVGCSQSVCSPTLVEASGAKTHMAKPSQLFAMVRSRECARRRTQRPSSGSGEAPRVSSRVCHWKVQHFCK